MVSSMLIFWGFFVCFSDTDMSVWQLSSDHDLIFMGHWSISLLTIFKAYLVYGMIVSCTCMFILPSAYHDLILLDCVKLR